MLQQLTHLETISVAITPLTGLASTYNYLESLKCILFLYLFFNRLNWEKAFMISEMNLKHILKHEVLNRMIQISQNLSLNISNLELFK
jgi:hypothetical protein